MDNKAAVLTDAQRIEIVDYPMPEMGDNDVLIEIKHCGICGSDVEVYKNAEVPGLPPLPLPLLLGHEAGGVVAGMGKNVTGLQIGDKVALEPGIPCGHCDACRRGEYNLCDDVMFLASPPWKTGAMCKYMVHDQSRVFRLPENLSTIEGALMEPFTVGMSAAQRGGINPKDAVAVIGGGCIGMMTALACRAHGARNVIIADLFDSHLDIARNLGFTNVFNSSKEDLMEGVLERNEGQPVDVAFETAGSGFVLSQIPRFVRRGGKIVLVGNIFGEVKFDFWSISYGEIEILPIFRYRNLYPASIATVANGRADTKNIGVKLFPFEETQAAFDCALNDKLNTLKVVVEF